MYILYIGLTFLICDAWALSLVINLFSDANWYQINQRPAETIAKSLSSPNLHLIFAALNLISNFCPELITAQNLYLIKLHNKRYSQKIICNGHWAISKTFRSMNNREIKKIVSHHQNIFAWQEKGNIQALLFKLFAKLVSPTLLQQGPHPVLSIAISCTQILEFCHKN